MSGRERGKLDINPDPLRVRGDVPQPDYNAGRCDAIAKNGLRCQWDAKWSVLTTEGEREVCGIHARALRTAPTTMAMERIDG